MLQPAARTTMGAAAAALYFAVCALFSAGLVWTGGGLLPVMPGAEAPVSGAVRKRIRISLKNQLRTIFRKPENILISAFDLDLLCVPWQEATRRPQVFLPTRVPGGFRAR